jgi:ParB-like chromosome segregation protein Spo0J
MVKLVKIGSVKGNSRNPRFIRDEKFKKLVASLVEFPEMANLRPLVVDENMTVLGGNMRLKAMQELKWKEVPIVVAEGLTDAQKDEFVIKDNVSYGQYNWEMLANEWDAEELTRWGLEIPGFDLDADLLTEDFELPDGDKAPFQQMTFTLADEQAEQIKNAITDIKQTEEYKFAETMGNENSNGNALYLIIMQWAGQKK